MKDSASSHIFHQDGMTGTHLSKLQVMSNIKSAEALVIIPSLLSCLARPQKRNCILSQIDRNSPEKGILALTTELQNWYQRHLNVLESEKKNLDSKHTLGATDQNAECFQSKGFIQRPDQAQNSTGSSKLMKGFLVTVETPEIKTLHHCVSDTVSGTQ